LGNARDHEVLIQRSLRWAAIVPVEELSQWIIHIARDVVKSEQQETGKQLRDDMERAHELMKDWQRMVPVRLRGPQFSWRSLLRVQLADDLDALGKPVLGRSKSISQEDQARLHDFRIRCKRLRYQIEIMDELEMVGDSQLLTCIKTAQEELGILHDTMVCIDRLQRSTRSKTALSASSIATILDAERHTLQAQSRKFQSWWKREHIVKRLHMWLDN
jgi:CHAD domain-containing protein